MAQTTAINTIFRTVEILSPFLYFGFKFILIVRSTLFPVSAGTVDYATGEILLSPIRVTSTEKENNVIEVQAFPESNDVVGLTDLYLSFSVADSQINMLKDVISSGENISGVTFTKDYYTSSYSNGDLERK